MTIRCAQGALTISSALTAGSTINVTTDGAGVALTDFHAAVNRAVIFRLWSRGVTGFGGSSVRHSTGFATGTAARRCYAGQTNSQGLPSDTDRTWRNDAIAVVLDGVGAVSGLVDYNGEVTNGFQLIIDDQLPGDRIVLWMAIWGEELVHAIHDFTSPSVTGNQDYNVALNLVTGQNDKAVLFVGGPNAAANTVTVHNRQMIGAAAGDTPANGVTLFCSEDNANPTIEYSYGRLGECIAMSNAADEISERAALTQWNADGFRLNWSEVNGTAGLLRYSALVLQGPQLALWDILSRTDTTQTDEVVGFDPLGIMALSHSRAQSASDTVDATAQLSVGFATGATSRSVSIEMTQDNVSTNSSVVQSLRTDAFYASLPTSSVTDVDALMDLVDMSVGGGGFTYVMDDTEPSQSLIFGLAIGAPVAGSVANSSLFDAPYYHHVMIEDER
jgi:hypothetical protein